MKKIWASLGPLSLRLLSLLPFTVIYFLSDLLFLFLYVLVRYRRDTVQTNLRNAFPEKSFAERRRIARGFYRFLADQVMECIKMISISETSLKRRFKISNLHELNRHFHEGKSVIAVTGHYGNWEWGALLITMIIQQPVLVVYKPFTDKRMEAMIHKARTRFGAIMVPMRRTLQWIVRFKDRQHMSILLTDQTPASSEVQYFVPFLNQATAVFLGAEKIAKLTNNPVVYCHIDRPKRGHYVCTFKTLVENPAQLADKAITKAHTQELESCIRQRPELWLWSHKRWKFNPHSWQA